jgi:ATP-dependent helicase/nuclease subunit A
MTRAAQRLTIAGYENAKGRAEGCWHDLIRLALEESMIACPAPWGEGDMILRFGEGMTTEDEAEEEEAAVSAALPPWLSARAAPEIAASPPLRPSQSVDRGDRGGRVLAGRLAHALLHMLPGVDAGRRCGAAKAFLDAQGAALAELDRAALAELDRAAIAAQAAAPIEAPEFAFLFGPGSRGEVALAGVLHRPEQTGLAYNGRLDRLVETDEAILIVDFKQGPAPVWPAPAHVAQLAVYRAALRPLYPSKAVCAGLVYLDGPTLRWIEDAELDAALDAFTGRVRLH